jgi:CBS domain containing-hemolysin-like protein
MLKRRGLQAGFPGVALLIVAVAEQGLPDASAWLVPLLIIAALILLNGLFVAAEFAIIGIRATRMEQLAAEGHAQARSVLAILDSPRRQDRYVATAQLGITIASLGLGMYGEPQIAHTIEPVLARIFGATPSEVVVHTVASAIALSLLTYLHVVLGEMIPKSLALASAERAVFMLNRPMRLMQFVFHWPVKALNGIGNLLLRLLRIPPVTHLNQLLSPEELELVVSESAERGLLTKQEAEYIENIFDLRERHVHQVMVPRSRVQAIAHDTPPAEILRLVENSQYSRFPVYEEDLDHITGILHLSDLVCLDADDLRDFNLRALLRKPLYVPEHYRVDKLLASLKRQRSQMAIAFDEYGGTAGIVTLQDLIEEVVGEVQDEFKESGERIVKTKPGEYMVVGDTLLEELAEIVPLGDKKNWPDVETVGGLIMSELDRMPQIGDAVNFDRVRFTVLGLNGLAVGRTRIELHDGNP